MKINIGVYIHSNILFSRKMDVLLEEWGFPELIPTFQGRNS